MRFGISGPGCRCSMENLAFNAYAYHQQKIEDFINTLAAFDNPNESANQYAAAQMVELNINSLTSDEIDYIEREVTKRYGT